MNTCDFIWKLLLSSLCEELTSRSPTHMSIRCVRVVLGWAGWVFHYELWASLTPGNDCCRWVIKLSAVQIKLRCYATGMTCVPKHLLLCSAQRAPANTSQGRLLWPKRALQATAESNTMEILNNCFVSLCFYLLFITCPTIKYRLLIKDPTNISLNSSSLRIEQTEMIVSAKD